MIVVTEKEVCVERLVCVCVWFYYTPFSAKPEESPIYNREFGHI